MLNTAEGPTASCGCRPFGRVLEGEEDQDQEVNQDHHDLGAQAQVPVD